MIFIRRNFQQNDVKKHFSSPTFYCARFVRVKNSQYLHHLYHPSNAFILACLMLEQIRTNAGSFRNGTNI